MPPNLVYLFTSNISIQGMHHVLEQSLTNGRVSPVTSFKSRALERFVFVLFVLEVLMHDVPQYYNI